MPRLPRIYLESAIYYVTSKGSENQAVFKDKADLMMYLDLLTKYKKQHGFKLFSYCLLPDRLELLIQTGESATISEIMHDLNSLYTKYYNGRYQRKGHVFESRFRSVLVEKTKYLAAVTRHIHLAPTRQESPMEPSNYLFSSLTAYMGTVPGDSPRGLSPRPEMLEEIQEVVDFLKKVKDGVSYEKYCLEGDADEIAELEKNLRRASVLGSEKFTAEVKNRVREYSEELKEGVEAAPRRGSILFAGGAVLVVSALSVYLYIAKTQVENHYEELLRQKNAEYEEKTRFENRSPLAPEDLKGTEWNIELVSRSDKAAGVVKDAIHFSGNEFSSTHFAAQGFKPVLYTITARGNGVSVWKAEQKNTAGDTLGWRGTWQGDAMKGIVSLQPVGQNAPRDFSFFSTEWKRGAR